MHSDIPLGQVDQIREMEDSGEEGEDVHLKSRSNPTQSKNRLLPIKSDKIEGTEGTTGENNN